jgi:hypothetical protein
MTTRPQSIAPNPWLRPYPPKILAVNLGRKVTIIRLTSGKSIMHSTVKRSYCAELDPGSCKALVSAGALT